MGRDTGEGRKKLAFWFKNQVDLEDRIEFSSIR